MEWIQTLGETQAKLLRLVREEARSVSQLAALVGISTNAVRTHVAGLERDGLVRPAGLERGTGGKPARLYELTPAAEELFPKAYATVLRAVVEQLAGELGEGEAEEFLRRVGRSRAAGVSGIPPGDVEGRVHAAAGALNALGGSVGVRAEDGGWVLRSAGCPLSAVVRDVPVACVLAESLVATVTGLPVEERCDRGERPRCGFHVSAKGVEGP